MDALLGSVTMKVSYPHVLPLEVIHEVSHSPYISLQRMLTIAGYKFSVHIQRDVLLIGSCLDSSALRMRRGCILRSVVMPALQDNM